MVPKMILETLRPDFPKRTMWSSQHWCKRWPEQKNALTVRHLSNIVDFRCHLDDVSAICAGEVTDQSMTSHMTRCKSTQFTNRSKHVVQRTQTCQECPMMLRGWYGSSRYRISSSVSLTLTAPAKYRQNSNYLRQQNIPIIS
jgi:hypothetical protein